jgi:hypothetical protein
MPRVAQKACQTLKQLCLQNICTHIDTLWCKNFLDLYYKNAHWIYILGPFDSLPPNLIQAIRTVASFIYRNLLPIYRLIEFYLLMHCY